MDFNEISKTSLPHYYLPPHLLWPRLTVSAFVFWRMLRLRCAGWICGRGCGSCWVGRGRWVDRVLADRGRRHLSLSDRRLCLVRRTVPCRSRGVLLSHQQRTGIKLIFHSTQCMRRNRRNKHNARIDPVSILAFWSLASAAAQSTAHGWKLA